MRKELLLLYWQKGKTAMGWTSGAVPVPKQRLVAG
jgi:hypothetical protein